MSEHLTHSAEIDAPVRRSVNGHTLELQGTYWRCLQCRHAFETANDASLFWCGEDCTGKHYGDQTYPTPPGASDE